jgi:prepilin-type N-terminal cleavage/methylation domain-containing protein
VTELRRVRKLRERESLARPNGFNVELFAGSAKDAARRALRGLPAQGMAVAPSPAGRRSTMQKFRSHAGFTLIEMMTVIAIVGFITAMGITSLRSYSRHEDTRKTAVTLANVLTQARSEARTSGRITYVVFNEPVNGLVAAFQPGQVAAMFKINDLGLVDEQRPFFGPSGNNPHVTRYGEEGSTELKTVPLPSVDESSTIPDGVMASTVSGMTIPVDPDYGVPMIGFSPQGAAVTRLAPDNWGGGAGGVYVTDNDEMLLAVVVQPLGDVKTLAYDEGAGQWR